MYPADSNINLVIEDKINFLIETRNEILNDNEGYINSKEYVEEVNNIIDAIETKTIDTIIVAKLPINEFSYKDSNGDTLNITIYHWFSDNTIIIDK